MIRNRYVVTAWHGESGSTFYAVDLDAERGEWVIDSFSTVTHGANARALADAKVAELRGGGR